MANKPKIYGFCSAGCRWETVHKDDFLRSASIAEIHPNESGVVTLGASGKYRIYRNEAGGECKAVTSTLNRKMSSAACATYGNYIYLFGGFVGSNIAVSDIRQISISSNTGTTLTSLPTAAYNIACATIGNKAYLIGGCKGDGTGLDTIQVFDMENKTLTTLSAKLTTGAYFGACAVIGNKVYLFSPSTGGYGIQVFDTATGTVTALAAVTTSKVIGAVAIGSKIYLPLNDTKGTIEIFDTESGTVETAPFKLPYTSVSGFAFIGVGDKIYALGGYDNTIGNSHYLQTIVEIDTVAYTSKVIEATLPTATTSLSGVACGTDIYLFGGNTASGLTDAVTKFDTYADGFIMIAKNGQGKHTFVPQRNIENRDYFTFEILREIVTETSLTLVYEINGKRERVYIYGYAGITEGGTSISITNAKAVYRYNEDAEILVVPEDISVVQTRGDSEEDVMSQAAVSTMLSEIEADTASNYEKTSKAQEDIETLYNIINDTVMSVDTVEDTYTERTTAGGLNIVNGLPTTVKKIQGSTTVDENGDLRNAVFSSIYSRNQDGTASDEWMPAEDFELGAFDYIDVENQQVVRQTFSFAVADMAYGWCGMTAFGSTTKYYFAAFTLSGLPKVYDGQYERLSIVSNYYPAGAVTTVLNKKCIMLSRTAQDAALFNFRDDDLLVFNDDGTINNDATLEAFKAHFAEIGLQIAFKTSEVLETDDIVCPKSYIAYRGGTEVIEYQGEVVTVTQDYYVRTGGTTT